MRFILTLLFLTLPLQAAAQVECSVIDGLERIQFAGQRLSEQPTLDPESADAVLIIRETKRLDSDKVKFAATNTLTPLDVARLVSFYQMSEMLARTIVNRRPDKSYSVFTAPSFNQHMTNTKRILPMFSCNPLSGVRGADGLEKVSSTLGESKAGKPISIKKIGFWLVGLIAAGILASLIKVQFSLYMARKKRRSQRFRVHIPTKVKMRGTRYTGTILDISCNGVKIQIDHISGGEHGAPIDIWINAGWQTAHISWSNIHYVGVRFADALQHKLVMALVDDDRHAPKARKNGALKDAVLLRQR